MRCNGSTIRLGRIRAVQFGHLIPNKKDVKKGRSIWKHIL
nr:MAG TPA: hypothetical protein [Caudoviricetes sp.]